MFEKIIISLVLMLTVASGCTDFYMGFDNFKLSARTMDLGSYTNWTLSTWPRGPEGSHELAPWPVKYASLGISGNWLGDDKPLLPVFYGDSLNEKGLSCSMLTLIDSQYQERNEEKLNIFNGMLCHYFAQSYESVYDIQAALPNIAVYGPDALDQHYVVRDASGASLVLEFLDGEQKVYIDRNDGETGFGIMTNEPTFDWHLENINHYQWKRGLARQSVAIPGNFYPEERFLRTHMMKQGMVDQGLMTSTVDFQSAFALTVQVQNSVFVPMGDQYGTDSGEGSGESDEGADHSQLGIVRDHANLALYWRTAMNPSYSRVRMADLDMTQRKSVKMEEGAFFIDVATSLQ